MAAGQLRIHRRMAADRPPCRVRMVPHTEDLVERHHQVPAPLVHVGSIDGSRIFTHFPPADTYAAWCKVQELDYAEKNFQDKDLADRSLLLFGFGDGGGGPTRNMMEHLHRYENLEGVSKVSIEEPNDFFDKAHQQLAENAGPEMPVWKGELYLELHRGTLTSQQDMKRGCRQEECRYNPAASQSGSCASAATTRQSW